MERENDDQRGRLAELTASTTDPAKDLPLRRDVRLLGTLAGPRPGRTVWRISSRRGGGVAANFHPASRASAERATAPEGFVSRFQGSRFQRSDYKDPLLNQARKSSPASPLKMLTASPKPSPFISSSPILRRPLTASAAAVPPNCILSSRRLEGSFRGTLKRMRAAGISVEQALAVLRKIKVVPVFTAHPTEVARRTVLLKRRRIAKQLETARPAAADRRRCQPIRVVDLCRSHSAVADR